MKKPNKKTYVIGFILTSIICLILGIWCYIDGPCYYQICNKILAFICFAGIYASIFGISLDYERDMKTYQYIQKQKNQEVTETCPLCGTILNLNKGELK